MVIFHRKKTYSSKLPKVGDVWHMNQLLISGVFCADLLIFCAWGFWDKKRSNLHMIPGFCSSISSFYSCYHLVI
jgi:hypothetical protein